MAIGLIGNAIESVLNISSSISTLANVTILSSLLQMITENKPFPKVSLTFKDEYDYIIVGAGSAGSVMASRLSENPCVSVLLLEAGNVPTLLTEVPAFSTLLLQSDIDWKYETTPQEHAGFGQIDNKIVWSSGKCLGGSSSLNAMLYARGNKKDFDQWSELGADGWSYKDVFPYFMKLEDNRNMDEVDSGFHSTGGPITVEKPKYKPEIKDPVINALNALGFNITDPNGKKQTGIYDLQATMRNGRRCSASKGYLVPAENRRNLDILVNAFARKIRITKKKARGIEFDYNGKTRYVKANREVIISSGAIRTPQILMLSGIGPKEHLEKFNITVVSDLPVGKNLQDHYGAILHYLVSSRIPSVFLKVVSPVSVAKYLITNSGPWTSPGQVSIISFMDGLDPEVNSEDSPKQELLFMETTVTSLLQRIQNMKPEIYDKVYKPHYLKPMYQCFSSLLQPKSRGEITLNSTDPYDQPNINPNYYQDERDLKVVVEGMKICQLVCNSKEMEKIKAKPISTPIPGCEKYYGDDDKYFACFAKSLVNPVYHPVGTARMGHRDDPRSVVDPQLRVIGVERLRVVNGAVMPVITSGNLNVPIMMIAEKAYDMMKKDIKCDKK